MLNQCAWCRRVEVGDKWIEKDTKGEEVSHGICPECRKKVMKEFKEGECKGFLYKCGIDAEMQAELDRKIAKFKDSPGFLDEVSRLRRMLTSMSIVSMDDEEVPEAMVDLILGHIADILSWE